MTDFVDVIIFSIPWAVIIVFFVWLISMMNDGAGGIGGYK